MSIVHIHMPVQYCRFSTTEQGFPFCAEPSLEGCTYTALGEVVLLPVILVGLWQLSYIVVVSCVLSTCVFVSIHPSTCLLPICLSVCLFICLLVYPTYYTLGYLYLSSICLSVYLIHYLYTCVYLPVCCLLPNIHLRFCSGARR